MQRETIVPRADWRERAQALGFDFHSEGGVPYWDETACYRFSAAEIDGFEDAANTLETLCFQAVERIIAEKLYARMRIPESAVPLIEASWRDRDKNLYGRFDFSYDGVHPPMLLEYNADTPTALYEASVVQWEWLESTKPDADQFNSIHERLIAAWRALDVHGPLHFTCLPDHAEDFTATEYLRDTAVQAGLETTFLSIDRIGWDGAQLVDEDDLAITTLFKLYPWEWLLRDAFAVHLAPGRPRIVEPAWKLLLSNKAILAILWEMFPGHPHLLPAFLEPGKIAGPSVRKALYGREGANVTFEGVSGLPLATDGPYGEEGFVWQAYAPLPNLGGNYPVLGVWMVASQAAGMGIREDTSPVTTDRSRFVPHYFV